MVQAVRSLKGRAALGEGRANTAEAQAREMLDEMSLLALGEVLNRTMGGERVRFAGLVDSELIRIRSVTTAALLESEGTVRDAICNLHDGFPVELSPDALFLAARGLYDQSWGSFVV